MTFTEEELRQQLDQAYDAGALAALRFTLKVVDKHPLKARLRPRWAASIMMQVVREK